MGCGACLAYHSLIPENEYSQGNSMLSSVSSAYCSGAETADLASIINDLMTTGSSTGSEEWAPVETPTTTRPTAVSNYFTATGEQQGPGLESLVTERTLTGEAPTSEPTDDGTDALSRNMGLANLCLIGGVVGFVLS